LQAEFQLPLAGLHIFETWRSSRRTKPLLWRRECKERSGSRKTGREESVGTVYEASLYVDRETELEAKET
jgi:hypothetical protein